MPSASSPTPVAGSQASCRCLPSSTLEVEILQFPLSMHIAYKNAYTYRYGFFLSHVENPMARSSLKATFWAIVLKGALFMYLEGYMLVVRSSKPQSSVSPLSVLQVGSHKASFCFSCKFGGLCDFILYIHIFFFRQECRTSFVLHLATLSSFRIWTDACVVSSSFRVTIAGVWLYFPSVVLVEAITCFPIRSWDCVAQKDSKKCLKMQKWNSRWSNLQ